MHGCMTEYVVCNYPRADGRIAVDISIKRYSNNGRIVDADDEYLST